MMKQGGHSHALSSADYTVILSAYTALGAGEVVQAFHSGKIGEIKGEG